MTHLTGGPTVLLRYLFVRRVIKQCKNRTQLIHVLDALLYAKIITEDGFDRELSLYTTCHPLV
jgi:hypothetical protein